MGFVDPMRSGGLGQARLRVSDQGAPDGPGRELALKLTAAILAEP